jgi:hypothetical protein
VTPATRASAGRDGAPGGRCVQDAPLKAAPASPHADRRSTPSGHEAGGGAAVELGKTDGFLEHLGRDGGKDAPGRRRP